MTAEAHRNEKQTVAPIAISWAIAVLVAAFIFFMSAHTGSEVDSSWLVGAVKEWLSHTAESLFGRPADVSPIGHAAEYLVFGIALANALRWHMPARKAFVAAIVIASVYGATDEWHQLFVANRSCEILDWIVDTVASAIGAALFTRWLSKRACAQHSSAHEREP